MSASMHLQREVRFGAVLYGGVSLCVYMNGIAQELLHLVKSTAPKAPGSLDPFLANPTSTQAVYRRLGQFLAHPGNPKDFSTIAPDTPIHTRFLIDAIAGTSAGGINGVFLAKALALEGDLTSLKDLWKDEGDIAKLINDKGSMVDDLARYELQDPPASLLNSQRMYFELLKALRGMDPVPAPAAPRESALVDELDLHITATDLRGLVLPIQLSDGQIFERRHRTSFHFRHSPLTSTYHFTERFTPFLAFAARCTSSFPVAFEPMQFADIDDTLRREGILMRDGDAASSNPRYQPFYPDYTPEALLSTNVPQLEFEHRAFADGGYLDNKPFSFVIDEILKRQGVLPIDRKLVYLEPDPETPEHDKIEDRRPNAFANAWMALSSLPRYETIRQDLERALDRNREIERLRNLLSTIESAAAKVDSTTPTAIATAAPATESAAPATESAAPAPESAAPSILKAGDWQNLDTIDLARRYGRGYIAYHRIKVATVTDDLTALLCDYFQVNPDSMYGHKLRFLVKAWRDLAYGPHQTEDGTHKLDQLNRFLLDFDIRYRIRRLHHLFRKLDATRPDPSGFDLASTPEAFLIRAALAKPHRDLHKLKRNPHLQALQAFGTLSGLRAVLGMDASTGVPVDGLKLAAASTYDDEANWAAGVLRKSEIRAAIDEATAQLSALYKAAFTQARDDVDAALHCDPADQSPGATLCRQLDLESRHFERHDVLTFPLLYNTSLGEMDPIEIFRISPKDAPLGAQYVAPGKVKVKGAALGAFAGFLEREWRENDILWGRLDGAERIITALLPERGQQPIRDGLIGDAHLAIVEEELATHPKLQGLGLAGIDLLKRWMELRLEEQQRKPWAETLARGATVIGSILDSIARRKNSEPTPLSAVPHLGRLAWGLIEVATPRSFPELIFRYWLSVVFAFGVLLIALGILIPAVQLTGWVLVALAAACKLGAALLQDYFQEDPKQKDRPTAVLLTALAVAVAVPLALFFTAIGIGHAASYPLPYWTGRFLSVTAGLAAILTIVRMVQVANASKGLPLDRIERWTTVDNVHHDAGDYHDPRRSAIRSHLHADSRFIAAYTLLFGALGLTILRAGDPIFAIALLLFGLAAAVADFLENERISRIVSFTLRELGDIGKQPSHPLDLPVAAISRCKWALFYGTLPVAAYWLFSHNSWPAPFEFTLPAIRLAAAVIAAYALAAAFVSRVLGFGSRETSLNKLSLILLLLPGLPALAIFLLLRALSR